MKLLLLMLALAVTAPAAAQETLEQLKQRAAAEGDPKVFSELAQRFVEDARLRFQDGKNEEAFAAVRAAVEYAERAAHSSIASGKRQKQTEIAIRKAANRLQDLARSLDFDTRTSLEKSAKRMHDLRDLLLQDLFKPKEKK